jgi:hypothetical protein
MKNMSVTIMACMLFALPCFFSACDKDQCKKLHSYTYYIPVYKTKQEARANIKSNGPKLIENPGKIYMLGTTIFLNEIDKGIHVINNADPSHPKNIAFIDIPGNLDIAAKGTMLYADMYTDLVALDISNVSNVRVTKFVDSLFPYRSFGGGFSVAGQNKIVVDWIRKDTTIVEDCENIDPRMDWLRRVSGQPGGIFFAGANSPQSALASSYAGGIGGSMARFTIMNDRLYTVGINQLRIYDISDPVDPYYRSNVNLGWGIETIYPFKNRLFIGSQTGMFVYDVTNADAPVAAGQFSHARSCDPVIADDNYAYVTLRSGNTCMGFSNELDIVKLNNSAGSSLLKVYPMTNPHGLSKDGNLLFICDGRGGVKIYNSSNVMNLILMKTIGGLDAYDVIAYKNIALVVAKEGLYQYNYANPMNIRLLSKIGIKKQG